MVVVHYCDILLPNKTLIMITIKLIIIKKIIAEMITKILIMILLQFKIC